MSTSVAGVLYMSNARGASAVIAPFGATLVELRMPDRAGQLGNVILALDQIRAYVNQPFFMGAICGRVANRIRNARFELDGLTFDLPANDPPHHLHGGPNGWYRAYWTTQPFDNPDGPAVALTHSSPAGDAGYPGTVQTRIIYQLTHDNQLRISMRATTDRPTPLNLTQHTYWNLAGAGTILDHQLQVLAETYTPGDPIVPTGAIAPVQGTPLDYRSPRPVGPDLDHNFVVGQPDGELREVARLTDPKSGRVMAVRTDQPGLQVYAGKFLDGSTSGRGVTHVRHAGVCLETQAFPNAINVPDWRGQVLLQPGQTYKHTVVYAFSTDGT